MWTIDGLETFLKNNNEVISVLIGVLSIVVSVFWKKSLPCGKRDF